MRWQGRRGSDNIEDRRGARRSGVAGVGGLGLGGVLFVLAIGYFFGIDVTPLLNGGGSQVSQSGGAPSASDQEAAQFVSVTLADTEEIWGGIFKTEFGQTYKPVTLVLFSQVTQSPCGNASGATGPFYCPVDKKVYLDTDFFVTLNRRFGAGGDFAAAYVVAHEVAHHVQDELGILGKANAVRQQASEAQSNEISVRIELQADCFSGVWARQAESRLGTLEPGDIKEAVNAAGQIGDDTLQRAAGRRPMPDSFTHGTSAQRQHWFEAGYKTGDINACDTFGAARL